MKNNRNIRARKKNNIHPGRIFIIVMLVSLFFALKEAELEDDNREETIVTSPVRNMPFVSGKIINYSDKKKPEEKPEIWVLYNELDDKDKIIYCMFLDLVEHIWDENYESAVIVDEQYMNKVSIEHLWNVYRAMEKDHPEYFFLLTEANAISGKALYYGDKTVYMYKLNIENVEVKRQLEELKQAKDNFLQDIDLDTSDLEIELQIHDKLIDMVKYDYNLFYSKNQSASKADKGYTAYGALVHEDAGERNCAVCAGYSFAFEYLLHEVGIPCAYISGYATDDQKIENDNFSHAWNLVKIENRWYEVDSTWDDFDHDGRQEYYQLFSMLETNPQTLNNRRHHFFNRTTAEMANLGEEDTIFYIDGYEPYQSVGVTHHVRQTEKTGSVDDLFF